VTGIEIYSKHIEDDRGYYLVKNSVDYKCGYEICRGPFGDEPAAKAALEKYEKTGKWDAAPPDTTEVDL
jgi:hypothetical protein